MNAVADTLSSRADWVKAECFSAADDGSDTAPMKNAVVDALSRRADWVRAESSSAADDSLSRAFDDGDGTADVLPRLKIILATLAKSRVIETSLLQQLQQAAQEDLAFKAKLNEENPRDGRLRREGLPWLDDGGGRLCLYRTGRE